MLHAVLVLKRPDGAQEREGFFEGTNGDFCASVVFSVLMRLG